jgi:hypothetical protein
MSLLVVLATGLLCLAIMLFAGTLVQYAWTAYPEPAWVEEIRRLRREGLAVNQEGER